MRYSKAISWLVEQKVLKENQNFYKEYLRITDSMTELDTTLSK